MTPREICDKCFDLIYMLAFIYGFKQILTFLDEHQLKNKLLNTVRNQTLR